MSPEDHFIIVNTDLDATLLDHDTYSWEPASPALSLLKDHNIPLILNSSKTLSEMRALATELGISHPLVCENGSLIAIPKDGAVSLEQLRPHVQSIAEEEGYWIGYLSESRDEVLEQAAELRAAHDQYSFQGYADWTVAEVAQHTGLPLEKASLSHQRCGTEPIHWHGSEEALSEFTSELEKRGLKCVSGGRFIHLSGNSDKSIGLRAVHTIYQDQHPDKTALTIALGDSPNDLEMLNSADIAIVIPNKVTLSPTASQVVHAEQHGPVGWNTVMLDLLAQASIRPA